MNHQHRGQSPRGNPHKVSLIHALHIWEGQPLTQNTPSRARFDSASHPFRVFIADGFSRRVYALPLVVLAAEADVFGSGGKYTTCSVPVAPVVLSRPPCNRPKMFWLLRVQTAEGCLFDIHSWCRMEGVVHPILPLLTKTACAP